MACDENSVCLVPDSLFLGEEDKELHRPTLSQTVARYGIDGTDLGYSFENAGHFYFLVDCEAEHNGALMPRIAFSKITAVRTGIVRC